MDKSQSKQNISRLIEKYHRLAEAGRIKDYNEAQTVNEFILPLFSFLGWDIHNINADEITPEEAISRGRVDWAFRIDGIPKFFLEAKAMKVDLDVGKWAEQAINYAWNKGCTWAILTDFEGIKVFNADVSTKNTRESLFFELKVGEYLERFEQLWLLSKEAFKAGLLDKEAEKWGKKVKRTPVGEKLFQDMMEWRNLLTKEIHRRNKLEHEELDEGVQRILDRLVFIRVTEDRGIEPNILLSALRTMQEGKSLARNLSKIFRDFDKGYNSKLFSPHASEDWRIDNEPLETVINGLYETKDGYRYDFSAISADVLGGIYEQYLGHILKQAKKRAEVKKEHTRRKEQGIYYTPTFVVDYMVKNTIGKFLTEKTYREIMDLRILDPACGSGSFLIRAYNELVNYFERKDKQKNLFTGFRILTGNIYGVDLDAQAVEIAQLNLLLKTLSSRVKLPNLAGKIRIGNSLISEQTPHPDPLPIGEKEYMVAAGFSLRKYFGENFLEKKPFTYEKQFPEVFNRKNPGFDVIIGNPPYVQLSMEDIEGGYKKYLIDRFKSSMGRLNTFGFFIKLGIDLLREGGRLGFIIPNTLLTQDYYEELREMILSSCKIEAVVKFSDLPFKDAVVENVIIILQKSSSNKKQEQNQVAILNVNENLSFQKQREIQQNTFNATHKKSFNIFLDDSLILLKTKTEKGCKQLKEFLSVNQAIALKHDRSKYLSTQKIDYSYKPVIDGRHINRYNLQWDGSYLKYDIKAIHSCKREDIFLLKDKLFFRRVGDRLIATLDDKQFYALNTLVVMNKKKGIGLDNRYFLALFNSSLLNFYYQNFLKSTKKVFSEIQARQVEQLPIKLLNLSNPSEKSKHDELVSLADKMLTLHGELQKTSENTDKWYALKKEIEKTDKVIDERVYELYGVGEKEINVIKDALPS